VDGTKQSESQKYTNGLVDVYILLEDCVASIFRVIG
jgi:hypothetical protein